MPRAFISYLQETGNQTRVSHTNTASLPDSVPHKGDANAGVHSLLVEMVGAIGGDEDLVVVVREDDALVLRVVRPDLDACTIGERLGE